MKLNNTEIKIFREALKLLISTETDSTNAFLEGGKNSVQDNNIKTFQYELNIRIERLDELNKIYDKRFPKSDFSSDDIPF